MKLWSDQEGSALMYVIVVMSVVFLLVAGAVAISMSENKQALYQADYMNAYYAARAGAESMAYRVMDFSKDDIKLIQTDVGASSDDMFGTDGDVSVTVGRVAGTDYYDVSAVGTYNNLTAQVDLRLIYRNSTDLEYAAYSIDDMGESGPGGSGSIETKEVIGGLGSGGSVYTGGQSKDIDIIHENTTYEQHFVFLDDTGISIATPLGTPVVDKPSDNQDEYIISNSVTIGTVGHKTDVVYKSIEFDTDGADYDKDSYDPHLDDYFTMSSGGSEYMIVNLEGEVSLEGDIYVTGSKNLIIIVQDALSMDGMFYIDASISGSDMFPKVEVYLVDDSNDTNQTDSAFKNTAPGENDYDIVIASPSSSDEMGYSGEPGLFKFYLQDDQHDISLENNTVLNAYILGPEATVHMKNGGTELYGGIYSKKLYLEASVSIIQPGATLVEIPLGQEMVIAYWE